MTRVQTPSADFEAIVKLGRDLKDASKLLGRTEARYLVDLYYSIQDFRIQAAGQVRSAGEREPNRVVSWVFDSMKVLEENCKKSLGMFAAEYTVGQWMQSIVGIGPVISAGFLSHLDVRNRKTAGAFYRFAGLDPSVKWEKGQKRPWNSKLKTLCWKLGECFIKFQNHEDQFYGSLFSKRKQFEMERNFNGGNERTCRETLESKNFGDDTEAIVWYQGCLTVEQAKEYFLLDPSKRLGYVKKIGGKPGSGVPMLPPSQTNSRARRWAVKIFVSHLHHVMFEDYYGMAPPIPYAMTNTTFFKAPVLIRDNHRCVYCNALASGVDHLVPVSAGGPDTPDNMVATCHPCNTLKGDKPLGESGLTFRKDWSLEVLLDRKTVETMMNLTDHRHYIAPPNWPMDGGRSLKELYNETI